MIAILSIADAVAVSFLLGLGLLAAFGLRRSSAAVRHLVLTMAVIAAFGSPLVRFAIPFEIAIFDAGEPPAGNDGDENPLDPSPGTPSAARDDLSPARSDTGVALSWFVVVWAMGSAVNLIGLGAGFVRLARVARRSEIVARGRIGTILHEVGDAFGLRCAPRIVWDTGRSLLATWGFRKPTIAVPADVDSWPDARIRLAIAHEVAHIRRRDWLVQMAAELLRCLYWFTPMTWMICRMLGREAEQGADDRVLDLGVDPVEYAAGLVDLARTLQPNHRPWTPALRMAGRLERRIAAMLDPETSRVRPTRNAALIVSLLVLLVTVAVSCARVQATTQTPAQGETVVTGLVHDPTGARVPGADVVLGNGVESFQAPTDATGRFRFEGVPEGAYMLSATAGGFDPRRRDGVQVRTGERVETNILLGVAGQRTAVSIVAGALEEPPPTPSGRPQPIRVTAGVLEGRVLSMDPPRYPDSMRRTGIEGTVVIEGTIGTDGAPIALRVVESVHVELARSALSAVRGWRYEPTLLNGVPVEVLARFELDFSLDGE
jgi:TonB family protein